MQKICTVRFDDICPTMDWAQFSRAENLMEEYGIKPLIGIIPNNQDEDQKINEPNPKFWEKMRQLQKKGYTVALHGYTHVYNQESPQTIVAGHKHSEFAGNAYEWQYEAINKGKKILNANGIETDVFFAPAHTYDKNTLRALSANGFRFISDGLSTMPYVEENVCCIPCRSNGIPRNGKHGIYLAVAHPSEWGREDKANDYGLLKSFCSKNKDYLVSYSELLHLKPQQLFVQKCSEKVYYGYITRIRPCVRKLLKTIRSMPK